MVCRWCSRFEGTWGMHVMHAALGAFTTQGKNLIPAAGRKPKAHHQVSMMHVFWLEVSTGHAPSRALT